MTVEVEYVDVAYVVTRFVVVTPPETERFPLTAVSGSCAEPEAERSVAETDAPEILPPDHDEL